MAAGRGVNEGKTEFVRDYLASHRDANVEQVNEAWSEAGKPGSISVSLVSKQRQKAGLTGKRSAKGGTPQKAGPTEKAATGPKVKAKPAPKAARAERAPEPVARTTQANGRGGRGRLLAEVEGDIDRLLFKLMGAGGMAEIEDELRRVRRRLVRSHEE